MVKVSKVVQISGILVIGFFVYWLSFSTITRAEKVSVLPVYKPK